MSESISEAPDLNSHQFSHSEMELNREAVAGDDDCLELFIEIEVDMLETSDNCAYVPFTLSKEDVVALAKHYGI